MPATRPPVPQDRADPNRERRRRKGWKAAAIASAAMLLFFGLVLLAMRDIAPADDSDLQLARRDVADDQNPIPELKELVLHLGEHDDNLLTRTYAMIKTVDPEPWDDELVRQLLDDNADALAFYREASLQTEWQDIYITDFSYNAGYLNRWTELTKLLRLRALAAIRSGDYDAAIEDALTMIRFAEQSQHAEGALIHQLVSITIAAIGLHSTLAVIDTGDLSDEQLQALENGLAGIDFDPAAYANAFRVEYRLMAGVLDDIASGKLSVKEATGMGGATKGPASASIFFKPNLTTKRFADAYRSIILSASGVRKDASTEVEDEMKRLGTAKWRSFLSTNAIGNILYTIAMPAYSSIHNRHAHVRASLDLIRIRIALERYRKQHGEFPRELNEVVPDFLPALPGPDPFDGEAYRYLPDKDILYSVGENFTDDGGVTTRDGHLRDRKEPVIKLE